MSAKQTVYRGFLFILIRLINNITGFSMAVLSCMEE